MTAHKHAELIKAKADNMELVVFYSDTYDQSGKWQETSQLPMQEEFKYFLCLPQHKNACFHLLNGGESEFRFIDSISEEWTNGTTVSWTDRHWCMSDDFESRIKPRKEKLWLAVKTDKHEHLGECRKVRICSHAFVNKQDAEDYLDLSDSQLIEIEVEV